MDKLYNWVFHFNSYKDKWTAFKRKDYDNYWNGEPMEIKLEGTSISDIIDAIKTITNE